MEALTLIPYYLPTQHLHTHRVVGIFEEWLGSQKGWRDRADLREGLQDAGAWIIADRVSDMTVSAIDVLALHAAGRPSLTAVLCDSGLCLATGRVLDQDPSPVCSRCHGKGVVKPTTAQVVRADQIATETAERKLFQVAA